MSPPTQERRPHKGTGAQQSTATKTSTKVARARAVEALRNSLLAARISDDEDAARDICASIDDIFVSNAFRRIGDRDIRRLRRQLREAS